MDPMLLQQAPCLQTSSSGAPGRAACTPGNPRGAACRHPVACSWPLRMSAPATWPFWPPAARIRC